MLDFVQYPSEIYYVLVKKGINRHGASPFPLSYCTLLYYITSLDYLTLLFYIYYSHYNSVYFCYSTILIIILHFLRLEGLASYLRFVFVIKIFRGQHFSSQNRKVTASFFSRGVFKQMYFKLFFASVYPRYLISILCCFKLSVLLFSSS